MMKKKQHAKQLFDILSACYPHPICELQFENPLQLIVATILSAQCTDKRVNLVTPALFERYKTARDFMSAELGELEKLIFSTGFYRNKAKNIQGCCRMLVEKHGGEVPSSMNELVALPGVGRKTANVIRAYAHDQPAMIVDTHVLRVSRRLGLSHQKNADAMERELSVLFPEQDWTHACTAILFHGRRCCDAKKPACERCPVAHLCDATEKTAG